MSAARCAAQRDSAIAHISCSADQEQRDAVGSCIFPEVARKGLRSLAAGFVSSVLEQIRARTTQVMRPRGSERSTTNLGGQRTPSTPMGPRNNQILEWIRLYFFNAHG